MAKTNKEAEDRARRFTWEEGDIIIHRLSNTVPKLPKDDMLTLFGKETYQKIIDGFNGPAYDTNGDQVTVASLHELYGAAFDKFVYG